MSLNATSSKYSSPANELNSTAATTTTTQRIATGMAELNPDASDIVPVYMQHMTTILVTLHLSVFISGLVGNSLVCLSVWRNKSLQTITNYYIVNLAVADFLVILICLPPTVYWDLTLTWNFGLVLCKLVLYLQSISVSVSVLTLTCISVDRWYAICKPLKFCSTKKRAKITISLIWLLSAMIASPDVIFLTTRPLYEEAGYIYMDCTYSWPEQHTKMYQLCIVTLLFVLPFVLMTISYAQIVNVLWRNETMVETMQNSMAASEAASSAHAHAHAETESHYTEPEVVRAKWSLRNNNSHADQSAADGESASTGADGDSVVYMAKVMAAKQQARGAPSDQQHKWPISWQHYLANAFARCARWKSANYPQIEVQVENTDKDEKHDDNDDNENHYCRKLELINGSPEVEAGSVEAIREERCSIRWNGGGDDDGDNDDRILSDCDTGAIRAPASGDERERGKFCALLVKTSTTNENCNNEHVAAADDSDESVPLHFRQKSGLPLPAPASCATNLSRGTATSGDDNDKKKKKKRNDNQCNINDTPSLSSSSSSPPVANYSSDRCKRKAIAINGIAAKCTGILMLPKHKSNAPSSSAGRQPQIMETNGNEIGPVGVDATHEGAWQPSKRRKAKRRPRCLRFGAMASLRQPANGKSASLVRSSSGALIAGKLPPTDTNGARWSHATSSSNNSLASQTHTTTTCTPTLLINDRKCASTISQQQQQQHNGHSSSQTTRFCKLIESRKKAAKMLIVIVIMFGLCYLPIHFLNTLRYTTGLPQNDLTTIASLVSHWLCYFNSAVNPLIYNLMSGKFRHEFANLFFCRCFRRAAHANTMT